MLLNAKHSDEVSAALSIARNRASKCQLLRGSGHEDIADRYATSLFYDVREFIGTRSSDAVSDQTCTMLHEIVASARGDR